MNDQPPRDSTSPSSNDADLAFEGMSYAALRRYIANTSDPAERRRVMAWAAEFPGRRAYLEALSRTWAHGDAGASAAERAATDTAWAVLRAQLEVPPAETASPYVAPWEAPAVEVDMRHHRPVRLLTNVFDAKRRWTAAAFTAAAAVLLVAGALLLTLSARGSVRVTPSASMAEREVVTGLGQRATVKLGDGSTVVLASKSRLRFPADFGARRRELALEGQAYFTVVHDPDRPFIVNTGESRTVDIGTTFVVRAYPEDNQVQVIVTEGSVAFGRRPSAVAPARLREGWMGQLDKGAAAVSVREVDPASYTGWLTGQLIFEDAPLSDVAAELGRWYDIQVQLADPSLARETFTAKFTAASLTDALQTLTTVLPLRADRQGKTVVLRRWPH